MLNFPFETAAHLQPGMYTSTFGTPAKVGGEEFANKQLQQERSWVDNWFLERPLNCLDLLLLNNWSFERPVNYAGLLLLHNRFLERPVNCLGLLLRNNWFFKRPVNHVGLLLLDNCFFKRPVYFEGPLNNWFFERPVNYVGLLDNGGFEWPVNYAGLLLLDNCFFGRPVNCIVFFLLPKLHFLWRFQDCPQTSRLVVLMNSVVCLRQVLFGAAELFLQEWPVQCPYFFEKGAEPLEHARGSVGLFHMGSKCKRLLGATALSVFPCTRGMQNCRT